VRRVGLNDRDDPAVVVPDFRRMAAKGLSLNVVALRKS
jgi:hypothetical protein